MNFLSKLRQRLGRSTNAAKAVCAITGTSRLLVPYFIFDRWLSMKLYGSSPDSYMGLQFYNRRWWSKNKFLTDGRHSDLDAAFNSAEGIEILLDKHRFLKTYAPFVRRDWLFIDNTTQEAAVHEFASKHEECIVKPISSCHGNGVRKIKTSDIMQLKQSGESFLAEEIIENCTELKSLNPTSLNTIRVVTCRDHGGALHIMAIVMRIGGPDAVVDNYFGGGVAYHVDADEGIVDRPGRNSRLEEFTRHPGSKALMVGFPVPRFQELLSWIREVADFRKDIRYAGWDVAITPKGFELVEGNNCPGPNIMQIHTQKGLYDTLLSYI